MMNLQPPINLPYQNKESTITTGQKTKTTVRNKTIKKLNKNRNFYSSEGWVGQTFFMKLFF